MGMIVLNRKNYKSSFLDLHISPEDMFVQEPKNRPVALKILCFMSNCCWAFISLPPQNKLSSVKSTCKTIHVPPNALYHDVTFVSSYSKSTFDFVIRPWWISSHTSPINCPNAFEIHVTTKISHIIKLLLTQAVGFLILFFYFCFFTLLFTVYH